MAKLGTLYHNRYGEGHRDVLSIMAAEEDNLLSAWRLARASHLWNCVTFIMLGLRTLYEATADRAKWRRLVEEVAPEFIDSATDGPLAGREDGWRRITEYRVRLARDDRNWSEAERLQRVCVDWDRRGDLATDRRMRALPYSLGELADIQREQGRPDCAATYQEALSAAHETGNSVLQSYLARCLGHAFLSIPELRDLDAAEQWYRKSLEFAASGDDVMRARIIGQLGRVAYERFNDARAAKQPAEQLARYLDEAGRYYKQTLDMVPAGAVDFLATTHNQLGNIHQQAGDTERALVHFQQSIRYAEEAGDIFGAGATRASIPP